MPKPEVSLVTLFTFNHEVMATVEINGKTNLYNIDGIKHLVQDNTDTYNVAALQSILDTMQAGDIDELPEMNREHTTGQKSLF